MPPAYFKLTIPIFITLSLFSCSASHQLQAALRNPKGFTEIGKNVWIEHSKDSVFGKRISEIVPALSDSIERKQHQKILRVMPIYLCNTNTSFCTYAGSKYPGPRAKVTNKGFFITPRLEQSKDWYEIIYHELSHVAMLQNIGFYRHVTTPVWFHEGLATCISNGGGSGDVTDSAATGELLKGNHFFPCAKDNILSQKSFKNRLPPWMNYRQSMLFVQYLQASDTDAFSTLIENLNKRIAFKKAFQNAYGADVQEKWHSFIAHIQRKEKRAYSGKNG